MCQTIIVNKTHELSTPNDLIIMIPKAEEVLNFCIPPYYSLPEGRKANTCLCPVNLEILLHTLHIPYEYDPEDAMRLLIELPPEVVEQANIAELWENRSR